MLPIRPPSLFFFFNDTATTEIYTLSLHDALPICLKFLASDTFQILSPGVSIILGELLPYRPTFSGVLWGQPGKCRSDRKSTRLNSSHGYISYAVFCLKKKNKNTRSQRLSSCMIRH